MNIFGEIAFDPPPYCHVSNLKSMPITSVLDVLNGKRFAYPPNHAPKHGEHVFFGVADYLKLIACPATILDLKGIQSDHISQQA
ncbi:MAG: hypothetical protein ACD_23C00072G0003 [uncultured bacterium]|nr:MAG: hypothetical protein ACD_23C00072G0003 [uncultured bacterium]